MVRRIWHYDEIFSGRTECRSPSPLRSFEMARQHPSRRPCRPPQGERKRRRGLFPQGERPTTLAGHPEEARYFRAVSKDQGERIRERIYEMLHLGASIEDALSAPVASFAWPFGRPYCRISGPVWVALAYPCCGQLGIIMRPTVISWPAIASMRATSGKSDGLRRWHMTVSRRRSRRELSRNGFGAPCSSAQHG